MNIFTSQGSQWECSEPKGSGPLTTALCCFQEIPLFGQERCSAMKNMDFLTKLMLWAVQFVDIGGDHKRSRSRVWGVGTAESTGSGREASREGSQQDLSPGAL